MLDIKLYDNVLLKDGRRAAIVEIFDAEHFLADIDIGGDYDTADIQLSDILRKI